jgi:hypothetical protein
MLSVSGAAIVMQYMGEFCNKAISSKWIVYKRQTTKVFETFVVSIQNITLILFNENYVEEMAATWLRPCFFAWYRALSAAVMTS